MVKADYPSGVACTCGLFRCHGWMAYSLSPSIRFVYDSRRRTFALASKLQPDLYLSAGEFNTRRIPCRRLERGFTGSPDGVQCQSWEYVCCARRNIFIALYSDWPLASAP